MNRRNRLLASILLTVVGLLLGWSLLTAQASKSPQGTPEGFSGHYVFIKKKDGGFVALQGPTLRTLAGKTYLVGQTVPLSGVTEDELFDGMTQWVELDNIRRLGETIDKSTLDNIVARAQKLNEEKTRRAAQLGARR